MPHALRRANLSGLGFRRVCWRREPPVDLQHAPSQEPRVDTKARRATDPLLPALRERQEPIKAISFGHLLKLRGKLAQCAFERFSRILVPKAATDHIQLGQ